MASSGGTRRSQDARTSSRPCLELRSSGRGRQVSHTLLGGLQLWLTGKPCSNAKASYADEQSQVRGLLEERFQLAVHRETKQGQVYLLVVGKNGSRLKESEASRTMTRKSCGHLAGTRLTADVIATILSRQFERDVLNRTELAGKYDFELDWMPDAGPCRAVDGSEAVAGPSIFTAVQEQLGLKLEPAKGPVGMLVIDRVRRPSVN
jgi:uncharacterized protein (TIGR03435 family)